MIRFNSIRLRLTIWYAAIMGMVLIFFSFALYMTMSSALYTEVDAKVKAMAEVMASSAHTFPSHFDLAQLDTMVAEDLGFKNPGKFIQLLDNTGKVGQASTSLYPHPLPISITAIKNASNKQISFTTVKLEKVKYPIRMITYPVIENEEVVGILQLGTSLESVHETLHKLLLTLLLGVPASLILASLGGWFMARKSLNPVKDITDTARRITAQNLDQKIEVANPKDEVGRLAETINDMISRLNDSFKQISRFSSDVSHELRTPLTIMRGEMEVALRTSRTAEEYKEVIASSLEEVERMSIMAEELLLLSKAEHGELKLNMSTVALHRLLETIYDDAMILAKGKGIDISVQSIEKVNISGDELRLYQLFLNLVDNAVKYTQRGGKIYLSLTKNGEYAHISIKDTGIGISKEDQDKIFERFYRVDESRCRKDDSGIGHKVEYKATERRAGKREVGGTGLGLAICKQVVDAHRGSISVNSEIGKGSTFSVILPIRH